MYSYRSHHCQFQSTDWGFKSVFFYLKNRIGAAVVVFVNLLPNKYIRNIVHVAWPRKQT